jgi:hypothetical protein
MVKTLRKEGPRPQHRGGTLVGVFIGLVLGVLLCAGVMWYINGSSLPLQVREAAPPQRLSATNQPRCPANRATRLR